MKIKNRLISSFLVLLMVLNFLPLTAQAAEDLGAVKVIIENTTFTEEIDGITPAWTGVLTEQTVSLKEDSTMMSLVVDALAEIDVTAVGAERNYIESIKDLNAFDGGFMSGWMGTLNDWFTDQGFGEFSVKNGDILDGDEIRILYTREFGDDLGMSWGSEDTRIKELVFSEGKLSTPFNEEVKAYTLLLPKGTKEILVTPTAMNKNYKVHTFSEGVEYRRNQRVPVTHGSVITVSAGEDKIHTYSFTVEESNEVPVLKEDILPKEEIQLFLGKSYDVSLSDIFTDEDGDDLTYFVSINGEEEKEVPADFSFTPEELKTYDLVFRAHDGRAFSSSPYKVSLVVKEVQYSQLESLIIHTAYSPNAENVLLKNQGDAYNTLLIFHPETKVYELDAQTDGVTQLRFRAKALEADAKVTLYYGEGEHKDITWKSGASKFADLLQPGKNEFSMVVTPKEGTEKEPTTYRFRVNVMPTLTDLRLHDGKTNYHLDQSFSAQQKNYTLTLPESLTTLDVSAVGAKSGYALTYNGSSSSKVDLKDKEEITIRVYSSSGEDALVNEYTVNLQRVEEKTAEFVVTPEDAILNVFDSKGATLVPNVDGTYEGMFSTFDYTYSITKYGYITQTGTVPKEGGKLEIALKKTPGTGLPEVDAYWKNYRGSDNNMAITDVPLPIDTENINLKWNKKLGSGWSAAPSVQIIVDNALVVMAGTVIYKLDLRTGEILAQGNMAGSPSFGYTPPTYAEGMIFAPLSNGTIQAFNAKTLESIWVYKDTLGGQSLSPITYDDGYIYVGFWNGETRNANFVSISVTDENPDETHEAKLSTWSHTQMGGFYWAGAVVVSDAVIVGTDDGTSGFDGNSKIYSFNQFTGEIISALDIVGDQRSAIAYHEESGRIYFTTKNGYLYRADVDSATGELKHLHGVDHNAQATATPVVYKNRVYVGVGSGISSSGSTGNLLVADAETLEMVYAVGLKGYPQNAVLLTTAYEEESGYIYLYSTYNALPGGISMIKADPHATTGEDAELIELYDAAGFSQYNLTGIIHDAKGTLYYKNDSGNVLAVGVPEALGVMKLIDAIGEVTLSKENALIIARNAYDAMYEEEKEQVTNYNVLLEAEKTYEKLILEHMEKLIREIGQVTLQSEEAILRARAAYDGLKEAEKEKVESYQVLLNAEAQFAKLKAEVEKVTDLIDEIGEITLEREGFILTVREAYDALTEEQKEEIHNYDWLLYAEARLLELKDEEKDLKAAALVEELISKIGQVTRDSKETIEEARKAYNGLTSFQKKKVTNYSVLLEAESTYEDLMKEDVVAPEKPDEEKPGENLPGEEKPEIDQPSTEKPSEGAPDVETPGEKPSENLPSKPGIPSQGNTGTGSRDPEEDTVQVTVTLDDEKDQDEEKSPEEDSEAINQIKEVMNQIDSLKENASGLPDLDSLIKAYKDYTALTEEEKSAVSNASKLMDYTKLYGEIHHKDVETGVRVEGLPWHVQLVVKVLSLEQEEVTSLREKAGEHKIYGLYSFTLTDILTDEAYTLENPVEVTMKKPDTPAGEALVMIHQKSDSSIAYIDVTVDDEEMTFTATSFSIFGVLGYEGASPLELTEEKDGNWMLWLSLGAVFAGAMVGLVVLQKRKNQKTDQSKNS